MSITAMLGLLPNFLSVRVLFVTMLHVLGFEAQAHAVPYGQMEYAGF